MIYNVMLRFCWTTISVLRYTRLQQSSKGLHWELFNPVNISFTIALNIFTQVGHWNSRDGVVMDPRQPVIWLSGSVNVPKDTSTLVENTTIRVMTVLVSMKPCRAWKFYQILQTLSREIMTHSLYEMHLEGILVAVFMFTGYLFWWIHEPQFPAGTYHRGNWS